VLGGRALIRRRLPLAGLVALALLAFLPAAFSGFLADDFILLRTLRHVEGIGSAFSRNDIGEAGEAGHFYRPVWVLWNAGIKDLLGTGAFGFHAADLLLYAGVTLEVWALVRRLAGESRAWVAAAVFAVYPRHGETVAWVSGSTDLTATALALAALICATAHWRLSIRVMSTAGFAVLAVLAKEAAFVLPVLALLLLWALRDRRAWLLIPGATALAVLAVAIGRYEVIGGVGGYTAYPWTARRVIESLTSYTAASVAPPDLELLRHKALLLIPVGILALAAARLWSLWRLRAQERARLVLIGLAWFLVSLLPALNIAVDLNNANGERLMFLASVGLALAFAALVEARWLIGAVVAAGLALSLLSSRDWLEAHRISSRVVGSAAALAPPGGELVLLSAPENYRTAHIFPGGNIDAALAWDGRPDATTSICSEVVVREAKARVLWFMRLDASRYRGQTTWSAPFDFPVSRPPSPLSPDCSYLRGASGPPGLGLVAVVAPKPSKQPAVLAFFDGYSLRRCCPS